MRQCHQLIFMQFLLWFFLSRSLDLQSCLVESCFELTVALSEGHQLLLFIVGLLPVNIGLVTIKIDLLALLLLTHPLHSLHLLPHLTNQCFVLLRFNLQLCYFLHQLSLTTILNGLVFWRPKRRWALKEFFINHSQIFSEDLWVIINFRAFNKIKSFGLVI